MDMTIDTYLDSGLEDSKKARPNVFGYIYYWVLSSSINSERKSINSNELSFFERKIKRICEKQIISYKRTNIVLEGILKVIEGKTDSTITKKDFSNIKKIVYWFSLADKYLMKTNYYDNPELKKEVKKCLELSYIIEAEFKVKYFESKKTQIKSDKYFQAISLHSKNSLSKSITSLEK